MLLIPRVYFETDFYQWETTLESTCGTDFKERIWSEVVLNTLKTNLSQLNLLTGLHLQLFGAPRSKWAKTVKLPARFWGVPADDAFQSLAPAKHSAITQQYLLGETVENGASVAVLGKLEGAHVKDETLMRYLHHPEFGYRVVAMKKVVELGRVDLVKRIIGTKTQILTNGVKICQSSFPSAIDIDRSQIQTSES